MDSPSPSLDLSPDPKHASSLFSRSVQTCLSSSEKIVWSNCNLHWNLRAIIVQIRFYTTPSVIGIYFCGVFSWIIQCMMGKPCDCCSLMIPTWDDHSTCVKCRFSAGLCSVDLHNPCEICRSWLLVTWGRLRQSLRDARQKLTKRGTQHWSCQAAALLTWMDSASTSLELHSEPGSIADSELGEVDLELAATTANTLEVQVSIHQSLVEEPPTIIACQAPTMDIVTTVPQCAQFISGVHASPLGVTANHTTAP